MRILHLRAILRELSIEWTAIQYYFTCQILKGDLQYQVEITEQFTPINLPELPQNWVYFLVCQLDRLFTVIC